MRPIGLRRQGEVPARTALEVCARARRFVSLGAQRIRVFPPRPHRPSRPSSPFATKKSGVHRSPAHRCAKRAGTPDTSYFGATTGVVTTGAGTIAGGVAGGAATGAGCDVTGVTTTPVTSPLTTSFCFVDDVGVGSRCVSARRNRLREAEGMQCPDEEALRGAATSRAASAVRDPSGVYHPLRIDGDDAYGERWRYAGDYGKTRCRRRGVFATGGPRREVRLGARGDR